MLQMVRGLMEMLMKGLSACLAEEFSSISRPEPTRESTYPREKVSRREGGKIFGSGVKGTCRYYDIGQEPETPHT